MDQLKSALKIVAKAEPQLIADKRKREEAQQSIVAQTLQSLLSSYGTTLAEDETMLTGGGLSERQKAIVVVRSGEKRLLSEAIEFLRQQAVGEAPEGQSAKRQRTT